MPHRTAGTPLTPSWESSTSSVSPDSSFTSSCSSDSHGARRRLRSLLPRQDSWTSKTSISSLSSPLPVSRKRKRRLKLSCLAGSSLLLLLLSLFSATLAITISTMLDHTHSILPDPPQQQRYSHPPRVVVLEEPFSSLSFNRTVERLSNASSNAHYATPPAHPKECVPMADWQTKSFVNCNILHEEALQHHLLSEELELLGQGWFRHAWKMQPQSNQTSLVLKTLRLERDFLPEYYELHRRDAVAMERLTASPFTLDIYAFCAQSALGEYADFQIPSLELFNRRLRGKLSDKVLQIKLRFAASVAMGVQHVHSIDERPSMVHYDLNPRNIAIVGAGRPKLNDFNIAEFLYRNVTNNETCGFRGRLREPWWRAPEELAIQKPLLTEKVDVYALGNILFHILTTRSPRGKMKRERMEGVTELVRAGVRPVLPEPFDTLDDPIVEAFRKAMDLCFVVDPEQRGTARQVVQTLLAAFPRKSSKDEDTNEVEATGELQSNGGDAEGEDD